MIIVKSDGRRGYGVSSSGVARVNHRGWQAGRNVSLEAELLIGKVGKGVAEARQMSMQADNFLFDTGNSGCAAS